MLLRLGIAFLTVALASAGTPDNVSSRLTVNVSFVCLEVIVCRHGCDWIGTNKIIGKNRMELPVERRRTSTGWDFFADQRVTMPDRNEAV